MLTLVGDLDGQRVALETGVSSQTFLQEATANWFEVQYSGGTIHLEWPQPIGFGEPAAATGTTIMAPGTPLAGDTVCAGAGSSIGYLRADTSDAASFAPNYYGFKLRALSLGPPCPGAPITGSLDGCAGSAP